MIKKQDMLKGMIVEYFGNGISSDEIAEFLKKDEEVIGEIMAQAQREWDTVEVDEDGPNKKQDAELDNIIDNTVDELLS